ncbi:MAG: hypothetical protein HUJ90_00755 [Bacteroidales bacterium]|nr:hypothetical protein [Bacteroidales bacterium]
MAAKISKFLFCIMAGLALSFALSAQNQAKSEQEKMQEYMKIAEEQTNQMEDLYKLDYAQVFMVDTLFQNVIPQYYSEYEAISKTGATNTESYQVVVDKWTARIDDSLERIFTPEQWKKYMKSAAGKEKVKRDKRMAERAKSMGIK